MQYIQALGQGCGCYLKTHRDLSVADPGFHRGRAPTLGGLGLGIVVAENCMKMKKFALRGGVHPLDPPMHKHAKIYM